jgi:hypothetical protein
LPSRTIDCDAYFVTSSAPRALIAHLVEDRNVGIHRSRDLAAESATRPWGDLGNSWDCPGTVEMPPQSGPEWPRSRGSAVVSRRQACLDSFVIIDAAARSSGGKLTPVVAGDRLLNHRPVREAPGHGRLRARLARRGGLAWQAAVHLWRSDLAAGPRPARPMSYPGPLRFPDDPRASFIREIAGLLPEVSAWNAAPKGSPRPGGKRTLAKRRWAKIPTVSASVSWHRRTRDAVEMGERWTASGARRGRQAAGEAADPRSSRTDPLPAKPVA